MTTAEKSDKVFQSGLPFIIFNRPVRNDQLWDIKLFWAQEFTVPQGINCGEQGFDCLDDCLDDCIKYIEEHDKVQKIYGLALV